MRSKLEARADLAGYEEPRERGGTLTMTTTSAMNISERQAICFKSRPAHSSHAQRRLREPCHARATGPGREGTPAVS